jgi:hypothetical protein
MTSHASLAAAMDNIVRRQCYHSFADIVRYAANARYRAAHYSGDGFLCFTLSIPPNKARPDCVFDLLGVLLPLESSFHDAFRIELISL